MGGPIDSDKQLVCSFCGKGPRQVKRLIAGPGARICDECLAVCQEIIDDGRAAEEPGKTASSTQAAAHAAAKVTEDQIRAAFEKLTYRERCVLELRYGLGGERQRTLDDVARTFNVTRERIREIETYALTKLPPPRRSPS